MQNRLLRSNIWMLVSKSSLKRGPNEICVLPTTILAGTILFSTIALVSQNVIDITLLTDL